MHEVSEPLESRFVCEAAVRNRRVPKWRMVDGVETAKARLVAKGLQDPDLEDGIVGAPGCVSARSSHLRLIFLRAPDKLELVCLGIRDTCLQADGFTGDVFLRAHPEWEPCNACRFWKLNDPA